MGDETTLGRILAFAAHCETAGRDPQQVAQRRGWLDEAGGVTEDGLALVRALADQTGTPSVFRTIL